MEQLDQRSAGERAGAGRVARGHAGVMAGVLLVALGCGQGPAGGAGDEPASGTRTVAGPAARDVQAEVDAIVARSPGARQISENEVTWNDGEVVLTIPSPSRPEVEAMGSVHGCPSGYFCFYEHEKFGGRKLQFRDCSRGGVTQYLTTYGFENMTTSWVVNRSVNFINVNDWDPSPGYPTGRNLWNASSNSVSTNVGAANNDKADWFICYSN